MGNSEPLLKDIHLPPMIGWWPPAIGWWIIGFCLILLFTLFIYVLRKKLQKRIYLKKITRFLQAENNINTLANLCSQLLRRTAIKAFPDESIKRITGMEWLLFLDEKGKCRDFTAGAGCVLITLPYQATHDDIDGDKLIQVTINWIRMQL